jgi:EmrB/QacA subfamily drug resistance transporter
MKMESKWIILAITTLAVFMTPLDSSITNVAMPAIGETFNASFNLLALIPLLYLISLSAFMIPFGKLADIYKRKYFFISGLVIFTLASFFSGISSSIIYLLISRFIQGIGAALLASTSAAIVTESFPPNQRGLALGINVTSVYLGLTTGPFLGGLITNTLGWRYIFFVNIPIGIIGIIASIIFITNIKESEENREFNWLGAATLTLFLISITAAINIKNNLILLEVLSIGILAIIIFIITEFRTKYPLIGLKNLIKNRMFVAANITAFLNYTGLYAISFIMSFYLISVRSLTALHAGIILGLMPLTMAILSPLAGYISDRIGSKVLSSLGMAIITIGLIILSFISINTSIYIIGTTLVFIGIGMGLFSSPNTSAVMGSVEKKHLSIAASFLGTIRFVGQALSISLMALIISIVASPQLMNGLIQGSSNLMLAKDEFIISLQYIFRIFAIITFIGIFTSLARKKIKD